MKSNSICFTKQKLLFENERERERERQRRKGLVKSRIQTCVAYFSSALCCSRCLCLSFLFSLSFYVCICSLFLYLLFFSSFRPLFFFFSACLSLFIERFQRNCSLLFSQLIRSWSNFCQFFPPQLLISCSTVTHFSAFFSFLCSVTF